MKPLRRLAFVAALALVSLAAPTAHGDAPAGEVPASATPAPGERELLSRLVAPCCWNQTLDSHQGAAPDGFRAEIRKRLHAGESADAIEADFVARYGERVRAASGSTSLGSAALVIVAAALLSGAALARMFWRWRRQTPAAPAAVAGAPAAPLDALDDRLDAELRALD